MILRRAIVVLGCLGLLARPALAFKEPGHRAIEAAAYETLLRTERGVMVIRTLIENGVLNPPAPPRPRPPNTDTSFESFTVAGLVAESHLPDHYFDRQLRADRQCFHFNARGSHFTPTDDQSYGVPRGLVEDAYLECLGLVDALLRGILYDPRASQQKGNGIYTLMHVIEDSFADSHVARIEPGNGRPATDDWKIVYVKPWNLRTWPRYFLGSLKAETIRSHFSEEHHMGSDARDFGYLIERGDPKYARCLLDARERLGITDKSVGTSEDVTYSKLRGELVVPESCLSKRALQAKNAIVELLTLVHKELKNGNPFSKAQWPPYAGVRKASPGFETSWEGYREEHLGHVEGALTRMMATPDLLPKDPQDPSKKLPPEQFPRRDYLYPSDDLAPKESKEGVAGITTELQAGTPLWLGIEGLVSRDSTSHNRTVLLLDSLGWGVQVRLPIENELGERPVGVAFDLGFGLPLPLSDLVGLDELQVYLGVRGRVAYTAQSIFEDETRHVLGLGFGGVSLDFVAGDFFWFGADFPRRMYQWDFWEADFTAQPMSWSFSGGVAYDAF